MDRARGERSDQLRTWFIALAIIALPISLDFEKAKP
jgi:hypothetical protein